MKIYLKILSIAAGIQLLGFILTYLSDYLLGKPNHSTMIPLFIGAAFWGLSMVLPLFLVFRWCKTKRRAVLTYVLLPTNYTWLILTLFLFQLVNNILEILDGLPPNFG